MTMMRTRVRPPRGLSIIETTIALAIVAVLVVASVEAVGATVRLRREGYVRPRAALLARDLMTEILEQAYREPFEAVEFGPEPSEGGGDRSAFDDIDDYDGWKGTPPVSRDGKAVTGGDGFTRFVAVTWSRTDDMRLASGGDTGIKTIVVTVEWDGRVVARLDAMRTESWRHPPHE